MHHLENAEAVWDMTTVSEIQNSANLYVQQ